VTKVKAPKVAERPTRVLPAREAASIAEAARLILQGGLVAIPTETVYGLAADATNERAVAALYAAKGRPQFNPLIAHFAAPEAVRQDAELNADAHRLAARFWPGPLTLVAPVIPGCRVGLLARSGLETLALRVPSHPIARRLIAAVGRPLVAPSANRSGRVSGTRAEHVLADLGGRIDAILDAGPCTIGVESTIVACLDGTPRLLRPGAVSREDIEQCLGRSLSDAESGATPIAPGALASHYAPQARVRLNALTLLPGEAGLDFAARFAGAAGARLIDLSVSGDLREAAANLFSSLRALDAPGVETIAVAPIPMLGLGEAINDRLARAAADRPMSHV
jgi:L-threonylcarbamoyladenylate synthase